MRGTFSSHKFWGLLTNDVTLWTNVGWHDFMTEVILCNDDGKVNQNSKLLLRHLSLSIQNKRRNRRWDFNLKQKNNLLV